MSKLTTYRALMKTVTWRVIATLTSCTIVYIFTGSLAIVAGFGLIEIGVKALLYFLHELAWNKQKKVKDE